MPVNHSKSLQISEREKLSKLLERLVPKDRLEVARKSRTDDASPASQAKQLGDGTESQRKDEFSTTI